MSFSQTFFFFFTCQERCDAAAVNCGNEARNNDRIGEEKFGTEPKLDSPSGFPFLSPLSASHFPLPSPLRFCTVSLYGLQLYSNRQLRHPLCTLSSRFVSTYRRHRFIVTLKFRLNLFFLMRLF